jgi:hypothetical protein
MVAGLLGGEIATGELRGGAQIVSWRGSAQQPFLVEHRVRPSREQCAGGRHLKLAVSGWPYIMFPTHSKVTKSNVLRESVIEPLVICVQLYILQPQSPSSVVRSSRHAEELRWT